MWTTRGDRRIFRPGFGSAGRKEMVSTSLHHEWYICGAVCAAHAAQQSDAVATLYITLNEPGVCQQTPTVLLEAPHVRAAREDQAETNSSMSQADNC